MPELSLSARGLRGAPLPLVALVAMAALPLGACGRAPNSKDASTRSSSGSTDPHSHADPTRVRVRHVDLDLELDFEARELRGKARLAVERADSHAPLVLDSHGLAIERVTGTDDSPRTFRLGAGARRLAGETANAPTASLGDALTIELAPADRSVTVHYHTTEAAEALQWLAPAQTAGGNSPFLFTQGQSVLTRTWIPLQDSPGVRVTYSARVRAPRGLTPLMSAEQLGQGDDGAFRFQMKQAIPPYLIALACGDLTFRPVSARAGIWAEPAIIESARAEFEDTEAMIAAAEELFGPYRWERYDILVLPPSFPFGGMENPRLTFATPTVIAGDKSLVALIAHELAHSWSGNLVTNATWRDFWLNEGFTVYFENRIMERVYGAERARMEMQLNRAELEREMATMEPWQQVLHTDLGTRHPDDGFSGVPYNKGALFLQAIEAAFGREAFDRFLRRWFDEHAFQSVTTAEFRAFLQSELLDQNPSAARAIDVEEWLTQPGLPKGTPDPRSPLLEAVDRQIERWRETQSADTLQTSRWSTQEWLHFLEAIAGDVDAAGLAELDRRFALTDAGNAEILSVWLRLSIQRGYAATDEALERFLLGIGRRKFLTPLYTQLAATPAGRARALEIYREARGRYHAVARGTIDGVLGWNE